MPSRTRPSRRSTSSSSRSRTSSGRSMTLRELTPRSRDYIISFGERLRAPMVGAALRERGIAATVSTAARPASSRTTARRIDRPARVRAPDPASGSSRSSRKSPGDHGVHGLHPRRDHHDARPERLGLLGLHPRGRDRCGRDLDLDRCRRHHDLRPARDQRCPGDALALVPRGDGTLLLRREGDAPAVDRAGHAQEHPRPGQEHLQPGPPGTVIVAERRAGPPRGQGPHLSSRRSRRSTSTAPR